MCGYREEFHDISFSDWQDLEIKAWETHQSKLHLAEKMTHVCNARTEAYQQQLKQRLEEEQVAFNRKALQHLIVSFRKQAMSSL